MLQAFQRIAAYYGEDPNRADPEAFFKTVQNFINSYNVGSTNFLTEASNGLSSRRSESCEKKEKRRLTGRERVSWMKLSPK